MRCERGVAGRFFYEVSRGRRTELVVELIFFDNIKHNRRGIIFEEEKLMNSKLTPGEKNEMILEVEISAEEIELPLKQICRTHGAKGAIPGFRKGKVPQQIVENFIGLENLLREVVDEIFPPAYRRIIDENKLEPIGQPRIELGKLEKDRPIIITAKIPLKPEVTLGQYKGLSTVKKVAKVADEEVAAAIDEARTRVAKLVELPEGTAAENGHIVNIDFVGYQKGVPFEGGSLQGYALELGSKIFIPGFEEQLVGAKAGEERDVNVVFPADYAEKKLAGQAVVFHVKINNIKIRQLPELNDDFFRDISETAETVGQWREEVRAKLQERLTAASEEQVRIDLLNQVLANCEVEIPFFMAEPRIARQYEDLQSKLEEQGIPLEEYLKYLNTDYVSLRKPFRENAERDIKCELILDAIAAAEGIVVEREELEAEVAALADYHCQPLDDYKQMLEENEQYGEIFFRIRIDKAARLIFGSALIAEEAESVPAAQTENEGEVKEVKEAAGETGEVKKESKAKKKPKAKENE